MEFNATIVVSAVSFIVFAIIMNAILYQPILKIIEERNLFIDSNLDEARDTKDKASSLLEEKSKKIKDAHKNAKDKIAEGVENAKELKSQQISEATNQTKQKIEEEKSSLYQNGQDAKAALKSNVVDLAKDISEKLLGHSVADIEYNQSLVDEAMNNV